MNFLKSIESKINKKFGRNSISYDELSDLMIDFGGLGYEWSCEEKDWKKPIVAIYSNTENIDVKDMMPFLSDIKKRLSKRGIDIKFYGNLTKLIVDNSTINALVAYDTYSYKYPFPIFMVLNCKII